jgi:hypothetical protein
VREPREESILRGIRLGLGGVRGGSCVSEALGAFVASLNRYRGCGDASRLTLFDPESFPPRLGLLVARFA